MRVAVICLALFVLAGCGSSPKTHYFTLDVAGSSGQARVTPSQPVQIAAVNIPPSLDRRDMVEHESGNTVDISGEDRWTAPLGDMTRNILSRDLSARLAPGTLVLPDAPAPDNTRQIVVTISKFGPDADGSAKLEGNWSLVGSSSDEAALSRDVALSTSIPGKGGAALASAMSDLLGNLAGQMAGQLRAKPGSKGS
jgi:uncharacterized lipoprotein YmbA